MERGGISAGLGVRPMAQLCHESNPEQLFISFQVTLETGMKNYRNYVAEYSGKNLEMLELEKEETKR